MTLLENIKEKDFPLSLQVNSIKYEAKDVITIHLKNIENSKLKFAGPGSHIELLLGNGISRSYSLVNDFGIESTSYQISVKKEINSRGGSAYIHSQLKVGDIVHTSLPRNNFPINKESNHSVLIAGGIGITPIWCMAKYFEHHSIPWELWYFTKSPEDACFLDEIEIFKEKVNIVFTTTSKKKIDLEEILKKSPSNSDFYCCGPSSMIDEYIEKSQEIEKKKVHFERFSNKNLKSVENGFKVKLAKSKKEIFISPGSSILEELIKQGVPVNYSCKEGICGCCEVEVLDGEVDHRDGVLSNSEKISNKTMMVCCSIAKSESLTLNI